MKITRECKTQNWSEETSFIKGIKLEEIAPSLRIELQNKCFLNIDKDYLDNASKNEALQIDFFTYDENTVKWQHRYILIPELVMNNIFIGSEVYISWTPEEQMLTGAELQIEFDIIIKFEESDVENQQLP
jgi:hypothetical protein